MNQPVLSLPNMSCVWQRLPYAQGAALMGTCCLWLLPLVLAGAASVSWPYPIYKYDYTVINVSNSKNGLPGPKVSPTILCLYAFFLTNIMSELCNLIKPRWWVGQPFQSVKMFQSFFGKSDTLMIACCLCGSKQRSCQSVWHDKNFNLT